MNNIIKKPTDNLAIKINGAVNDIYAMLSVGTTLKDRIKPVMENHFGIDSNGDWDRRMAYDICETALTKFIHTYGKVIIDKANGNHKIVLDLLAKVECLMPTEYVRSEEQIELQQFSTPISIAYIAYLASGLQASDVVCEPSAGTGLLGAFPKALGNSVLVNEYSDFRVECLNAVYDKSYVYDKDAKYLSDMEPTMRGDVVIMNPPFARDMDGKSSKIMTMHIDNALALLPNGGRLVVITGVGFISTNPRFSSFFVSLKQKSDIVYSGILPSNSFGKHGTTVDTKITVIEKGCMGVPHVVSVDSSSLEDFIDTLVIAVPARREIVSAISPVFTKNIDLFQGNQNDVLKVSSVKPSVELGNLGINSNKFIANGEVVDVKYTCDVPVFSNEDEGMYHEYVPQVLNIDGAGGHPSPLVQSMAMASVAPPPCSYIPKTYANIISDGLLSGAQLETVIYAGQQHEQLMSGYRVLSEDKLTTDLADSNIDGATQYRKGYFLGDGTGCGKGRQVAGIILDNMLKGRTKAVWVSKSDKLYEDSIRDWTAIGGKKSDVVMQGKFKKSAKIQMQNGILFTTYSTLRSGAGVNATGQSRLQQLLDWLGDDFDGVIVFDEAHAMANAVSSNTERGMKKASAQGMVGLKLQNLNPDARVVYVSATGATDVSNLAYADRLGLWASNDFPFENRGEFMGAMQKGGIAAMEIISRDLKALGLYTARSLSYAGVEVDILTHNLTEPQVEIYNCYADAYKQIHNNLEQALESTNITMNGESMNSQALSTARGTFESNKQRFFNHLLTAMKCPTLFTNIDNDLKNGDSVVVQMVSTGGAMLERRLMKVPKSEWNDLQIDLTPREYIIDYLENSFPVVLQKIFIDENGESRSENSYDDNGNAIINQEAVRLRDEVIETVCSLAPVESALDQLIKHYGTEMVAEVTGRSRRIVLSDTGAVMVQNRSANANVQETNAFMSGQKRILMFSDAGGTGRSYHADLNCGNQQRRMHYLLEPGWRADNAVQGLGRTNRTNQACPPVFRPVTTNVKGERRFISTIAKRLDGLGAMTKGQRQTGGQGMFKSEDNLETDYAKQAMNFLLRDIYYGKAPITMTGFENMTALDLTDKDGGGIVVNLPPITKVLNRILALRIEHQNDLFDIFNMYLSGRIEASKANGTYEEGVQMMQAESFKVITRDNVYSHSSGQNTVRLEIERSDKTRFHYPKQMLEKYGVDKIEFVYNSTSENVAMKIDAPHITTEQGEVRERVYLHRVTTTDTMDVDDYNRSSWRVISRDRFNMFWEQQKMLIPVMQKRTFNMLTGLLLPIWNAMPQEDMTIQRLRTDDGDIVLGRLLSDQQLTECYSKLNLNKAVEFNIDNAVQAVSSGERVKITELLSVKKSLVNGNRRYEVIGFNVRHLQSIKQIGGFTEIIQYKTRLFVPEQHLELALRKLEELS